MQEAFGVFDDLTDRSGINNADFRWKENKLPYILDKSIGNDDDRFLVLRAITRFNSEMSGCLEIVYV